MRRSVIQLSTNTVVVSLPSKWAQKRGLKKGEEVDVEEQGENLLIRTKYGPKLRKTVLEAAKLELMLNRAIGALYKAGYDEIEVRFARRSQLLTIQEVLRRTCIGFEIVSQGRNFVVMREISKAEKEEFEQVMRRAFLFVLNMAEECHEAAKREDEHGLESIPLMDDSVNRYTDFCRRLLNKEERMYAGPWYYLSEQLERLGDLYAALAKELAGKKLSKQQLQLFAAVNGFLRQFYDVFYKFDLEKMEALHSSYQLLRKKFAAEKGEMLLLARILENTFEMNGALLVLHL